MNQQNNEAEISPFAVDFKTAGRLTSLSPFTIRAYVRSGKLRGRVFDRVVCVYQLGKRL